MEWIPGAKVSVTFSGEATGSANIVDAGQLPIVQAAEILGMSERHTRRLLNAYRKDGAAALAHGNRGRRPHNAIPESQSSEVVKLASTHYAGTNHTHLTELLRDQEGIDLSRPTVRRILVRAGIGSPRSRRPQQHRVRRRRMPQEGMLLQIDGSHHQWLGEKCSRFTLLLTVDDCHRYRARRPVLPLCFPRRRIPGATSCS